MSLIQNPRARPWLSLCCAVLWAMAFPLIKLGYRELGIEAEDLGGKILFAGLRFLIAGLVLLPMALREKEGRTRSLPWRTLLLFALFHTALHYLFAYIGLAYIPSARGSILDALGSFLLILLSCALLPDDHLTRHTLAGCLLGLLGVLAMNLHPGSSLFEGISLRGDGLLVCSAVCGAIGGLLTRKISHQMPILLATALGMAIGGGFLCLIALFLPPAAPWQISARGLGILLALSGISSVSFRLYNALLSCHRVSQVAIFNAFIPVLGVFFSALILGDSITWQTLLAAGLVWLGIVCINRI